MPAVWYCCGCKKNLGELNDPTWTEPNAQAKKSYIETSGNPPIGLEDNFCPACLPHAHAYWIEKHDIAAEALRHFNKTIENHRNAFFGRRRSIKVVQKGS